MPGLKYMHGEGKLSIKYFKGPLIKIFRKDAPYGYMILIS